MAVEVLRWPTMAVEVRGGGSGRSREEVGAMAGAAGPGNARQPELGRPTMAAVVGGQSRSR